MSRPTSSVSLGESILEEASGWFIDFNEGELDAAGRTQLLQWLRRSPEHVRAYIEIAAAWEDSSRLSVPRAAELEALIAQAAAEHNIIVLNPRAPASRRDLPPALLDEGVRDSPALTPGAGRSRKFVALAASVALAALGLWMYGQKDIYATDTGGQRSIRLADGSTVVLNSRSRLKVRFTESARAVDLLDGQALFDVRKDAARPFIVSSQGTRVRAVGTRFDVYQKESGAVVTVIEGRVAVLPAEVGGPASAFDSPKGGEVFLAAGEQLTVAGRVATRPVRVDLARATAWTQHRLIFDETPLLEVAAEFNRYNTRRILIEDPALAAFHIRGNFPATDPDRLVEFLRERFGVRVSEHGAELRIYAR